MRRLGRSGIEVSPMGLGCWAIGGPFWSDETPLGWGEMDDDEYTAESWPATNDVRGVKSPEWMKYFKDGKPNPAWLSKRDAVRDILTSEGRNVSQGALAWLWARSEKILSNPGFRTVAQVRENAAAMQFGPLTAEQMREIDRQLERSAPQASAP